MFAAEFEPAQIVGRRLPHRSPVSLNARLARGGLNRTLCKVTDLSMHGARLQSYSTMRKGEKILLTLPMLGQVSATVMWATDFEAGCQFHMPLDYDAYEQLTALV